MKMDKIHDPNNRSWISKPVKVEEYFNEFKEIVHNEKPLKDTSDLKAKWMMKSMGLEDRNLFSELEEVMKIDHLTVPDEVEPMQISDPINDNIHGPSIPKFYKTPIPPEATGQLKTLALQAEWLKVTKDDKNAKMKRKRQSKHDNDHWFQAEKPPAQYKNWDMVDRAVVFCVRIYRPFKHLAQHQYGQTSIKYSQEVWLLGNHTLADLRDKVWCPADLNVVGAQQVDTVDRPAVRASDIYKSSFIYMEGTFYIDRRSKNNIDYSEVIRKWADGDSKKEVGPFTTDTMETTRLDSLTLRLGYPYLYQHQGNHEHLISFIDVRMLGPMDPQRVTDYPMIRSMGSQNSRYCMVCQTCIAVWVTMNNTRVPENPFFFCGFCYKNFNFVNKKRVGSFEEYRYFDVNTI